MCESPPKGVSQITIALVITGMSSVAFQSQIFWGTLLSGKVRCLMMGYEPFIQEGALGL